MNGDQLWPTGWPNSTYRAARVVGQDAVGARALDAAEALEHGLALVEPAVAGGRREHRVLAADLIDEGRHAKGILHAAHDVEVGQARLDHHDVGAFLDVERDLAQGLVAVGGIHLVGRLVRLAERRRGTDRVAERSVEC